MPNIKKESDNKGNEEEKFVTGRMIVKIGTSTLRGCKEEGLDICFMNEVARQIAILKNNGVEVLIVTSGAVEKGKSVLKNIKTIQEKQVAALFGQPDLIITWKSLFENWGVDNVGQLLVTDENLQDNNLADLASLLNTALQLGIVIANANDAVSSYEMEQLSRCEDNDKLAGFLRKITNADTLLYLTDTTGIIDLKGNTVPSIDSNESIQEIVSFDGKSGPGTGGMLSKHYAALEQTGLGAKVIIANGRTENVILKVAKGENPGTQYLKTSNLF